MFAVNFWNKAQKSFFQQRLASFKISENLGGTYILPFPKK